MILTHGSNSISRGHQNEINIGGRWYPYVQIGNRLWITENLDWKFNINGSQIPIGQSGTPSTPAAWYYDNNETDYGIDGVYKCGLLYNWYAAKYLNDNRQTILPYGWRVVDRGDYESLVRDVRSQNLRAKNYSVTSNWPSNWNGTNASRFNVLPAGGYGGTFGDLNSYAFLITITEGSSNKGTALALNNSNSTPIWDWTKTSAGSLRLCKDVT